MKVDIKARLVRGLAALNLALDESTQERLLTYVQAIAKWNRVYNLTALHSEDEMLTHHLLDSLAIVQPCRKQFAQHFPHQKTLNILDVGSGAGLPGVVIAICKPNWMITCVDAVGKKVAFVTQVACELGLSNVKGLHERVENIQTHAYDAIVSRAFSSLKQFVDVSRQALAHDGLWCAMKGKSPIEEMGQIPSDVKVFHVEHLKVPMLSAERCLLWICENSNT